MSFGFEVRIETDIDNKANFETTTLVVTTRMENLIGDAGVISDTRGRQGDLMWPFRLDQTLAGKGIPDILVFQTGGVAGAHHRVAQMKVIAMGVGEGRDGDIALGCGAGGVRNSGNGLEQGQGPEL